MTQPISPVTQPDMSYDGVEDRPNVVYERLLGGVALLFVAYLLMSAWSLPLASMQHRAIIATFAWILGLVVIWRSAKNVVVKGAALLLSPLAVGAGVYAFNEFEALELRVGLPATGLDMLLMTFAVVTTIFVAWNMIGWVFPTLLIAGILFAFFGPYMPGVFRHSGFDLNGFTNSFYLSENGVFGSFTGIGSFIVLFVIFSALMRRLGAMEWIGQAASLLVGKYRGGPAKVSVVASSAMGAITGVSTANVAATGSFTIPLMKRNGYSKVTAGAIEAVSSSGSQIMPPVMGATVFLMVELVGIPYIEIAASAAIVAILLYVSIFLSVDLYAKKRGLKGSNEVQTPRSWKRFGVQGSFFLSPILVLIYSLGIERLSPARSALNAIIACIVLIIVFRLIDNPKNGSIHAFRDTFGGFIDGVRGSVGILSLIIAASLIGGILTITGLGARMSGIIVNAAGGSLLLILIMAAATALILGLGAPTLVAYSLVAILVAPAIASTGVPILAAHLFVFYYAVLGLITPPVAPDPFVAAGLSGASGLKTAIRSVRIAAPLFILPFAIVYQPALILDGAVVEVVAASAVALLGVYALSVSSEGIRLSRRRHVTWPARVLFASAGLALLIPASMVVSVMAAIVLTLLHFDLPGVVTRRSAPNDALVGRGSVQGQRNNMEH